MPRRSFLFEVLLFLLAFAFGIVSLPARAVAQKQWVETENTKRVALVIGNGDYLYGPKLKNPANDADAMAKALKALGFEVMELKDATNRQMVEAINDFGEKLTGDCVALCYYSGHGIQSDGVNYLLPVDFNAKKRTDIQFEAVPAARLLAQFEEKQSPVNIVILDACRNNPFRSFARSNEGGLGKMDSPRGTLIAYATAPNSVADDNSEGENGLYTSALLRELPRSGIKVEEMFKQVLEDVATASSEKQTPWIESSLRGNLYLAGRKSNGKIIPIEGGASPPPVVSLAKMRINRTDSAEMILIPAGEFLMGDDDLKNKENKVTNPRHTVHLSAYYIYKNVVTVGMYETFCQTTGRQMPPAPDFNPGWSKRDHPIVNVSWLDAKAYCDWAGVKLPTEAQWEKAARWDARAGKANLYPWGDAFDNSKLWCSTIKAGDAGGTAAVGSFPAGKSSYGVLDMAGNVWQWCEDWYDEGFWGGRSASLPNPVNESVGEKKYRVLRGGSWDIDAPSYFRAAFRLKTDPSGWVSVGFRACVAP